MMNQTAIDESLLTAVLNPTKVDAVCLAIFLCIAAYLLHWNNRAQTKNSKLDQESSHCGDDSSSNILSAMEEAGKRCVVFYGSQTGNAEDYATRLAQEAKSLYGLETLVANLEDYDLDNLNEFPDDNIAMFVLATYGEGEPTDNAVVFHNLIMFSDQDLSNLRYVLFGLGNSTYEHYNLMGRSTDAALQKLGARRIGLAGEGDDGKGTMEEDFLAWKDDMWTAVTKHMHLSKSQATYQPFISLERQERVENLDADLHLGGIIQKGHSNSTSGSFGPQNSDLATIVESRELFTSKERNCLHFELDIGSLSYTTGDHIAIWPRNSDDEVTRFLTTFGFAHDRDAVFIISALDTATKVPFAGPITLENIARNHLEICGAVSRQFLTTLLQFCPTEAIRLELLKLADDKLQFEEHARRRQHNIASLVEEVSQGVVWTDVPFSLFIEGLPKLQPRYYSISSSSLVQPNRVSITVGVESYHVEKRHEPFKGVASSFLLSLHKQETDRNLHGDINNATEKHHRTQLRIHLRTSTFRLPTDHDLPLILVGPGTGVAPMRAFVQERAELAKRRHKVGRIILFFGCRTPTEDFIYRSEWKEIEEILGDKFEIVVAFSRATPKKVYVQDRLKERVEDVESLLRGNASVYVCGNAANMARDVKSTLVEIITQERGVIPADAEKVLMLMKTAGEYQEDVW